MKLTHEKLIIRSVILVVIVIVAFLMYYLIPGSGAPSLHQSYFSNQDFYDEAFEYANNNRVTGVDGDKIKGLVVNHHLLAPHFIARAINQVATDSKRVVVLLCPNHFSNGKFDINLSLSDWQTPYGILENESSLSDKLTDTGIVGNDEDVFEQEHGISGIVAFIKKALPNSKILPVVFKDRTTNDAMGEFVGFLESLLPDNALVIASVDFSHDLPSQISEFHDKKSVQVLSNFEIDNVDFLDVDSAPSLKVLFSFLEKRAATQFTLLDHSNSAVITKDDSQTETTSHITGFFSEGEAANHQDKSASLLFAGNIELSEEIKKSLLDNRPENQLAKFSRIFLGNDITVASVSADDPDGVFASASVLESKGVNVVYETGSDYVSETEVRGIRVGIYYQGDKNLSEHLAQDKIENLKSKNDFIIAILENPNSLDLTVQARRFVDFGANRVLVGGFEKGFEMEKYNKSKIYFNAISTISKESLAGEEKTGFSLGFEISETGGDDLIFPLTYGNGGIRLLPKDESDILISEIVES